MGLDRNRDQAAAFTGQLQHGNGFLAGDMLLTEVLGGQGKGTVKKVRVAEDGQEAGHSL